MSSPNKKSKISTPNTSGIRYIPLIKDYRVHMESSDSSDHPGDDESMKYNYVKRGNQVIQIKRYSGSREIARFAHVLYNFGGSFIPPGQYSFPIAFKTGEEYPASFMVHLV
jgi:hypothetical protein